MSYENSERKCDWIKNSLKDRMLNTIFKKNPAPTEYNMSFTIIHFVEAEFMALIICMPES